MNSNPNPIRFPTAQDNDAHAMPAERQHVNSSTVKPLEYGEFTQMAHDSGRYWREWNSRPR